MPTTGGASAGGRAAATCATPVPDAAGPSGCVRFCWSITFRSLRSLLMCADGQGGNIQGWNGPLPVRSAAAGESPAASPAELVARRGAGGGPSRVDGLRPARRAAPVPALLITPPVLRCPAPRELGNPSMIFLGPRCLQLKEVNLPHLRRQTVKRLLPSTESR